VEGLGGGAEGLGGGGGRRAASCDFDSEELREFNRNMSAFLLQVGCNVSAIPDRFRVWGLGFRLWGFRL
jgi:hypothetical protein